jgi:hypothetical protein
MGAERKVYKILVGKPEGKRPLGTLRRKLEDWIKIDFRENGLGVWMDSTGAEQVPVVGCCE